MEVEIFREDGARRRQRGCLRLRLESSNHFTDGADLVLDVLETAHHLLALEGALAVEVHEVFLDLSLLIAEIRDAHLDLGDQGL